MARDNGGDVESGIGYGGQMHLSMQALAKINVFADDG